MRACDLGSHQDPFYLGAHKVDGKVIGAQELTNASAKDLDLAPSLTIEGEDIKVGNICAGDKYFSMATLKINPGKNRIKKNKDSQETKPANYKKKSRSDLNE